jgi:HK97 family phage prohead protease
MTTAVLEKVAFSFPAEVVKQAEEAGEFHVVGYAATTDFDLQGDVITEQALQDASNDLLTNSTVLLNHDITHPIGKVTKVQIDKNGLLIDALISKSEPEIIQKIKEGILNKFSIRGEVLEREKKFVPELDRVANVIERMTLLEVSVVSVPANPEAKAIGWYVSKALQEAEKKSQGGSAMSPQVDVEEISEEETKPNPVKKGAGPEEQEEETTKAAKKPDDDKKKDADQADDEEEDKPAASTKPAKKPKAKKDVEGGIVMEDDDDEKEMEADLEHVLFLLDTLIGMGSPVGPIAQQIKGLVMDLLEDDDEDDEDAAAPSAVASPAVTKSVRKTEVQELIASEVKRQVEAAVKAIAPIRKGVISQGSETDDVKKAFESLPPEKKLKVALALQQAS